MKRKIISAFIIVLFILHTVTLASTKVYITNSGSKYHTDGCRYLSKSKIAIDLEDAIASGYSPCSRCGASFLSIEDTNSSKLEDLEKDELYEESFSEKVINGTYKYDENEIEKSSFEKNKKIEKPNDIEILSADKLENKESISFIGTAILIIIGCVVSYKVGKNKNKNRR